MTTKMKVIKNGIEEERYIDYIEHYDTDHISNDEIKIIMRNYPYLKDNEHCTYTMDGKCYVYEACEDN